MIPGGLHPGTTSPMGCELLGLHISHPEPSMISECLSRVGLTEMTVKQGPSPSLCLTMETPKGRVEIQEVDLSDLEGSKQCTAKL